LINASNLAKDNIECAPPGALVAVIGPSEVGTRVLGKSLLKHYLNRRPEQHEGVQARWIVPGIGIEAPSSAGRITEKHWVRILKKLLQQCGDILIDKKIYVPPCDFELQYSVPPLLSREQDIDTLMAAASSLLRARDTEVVVINQSERLFPADDRAGCLRSKQILGDLAAQSQCRFVLLSNYEILQAHQVVGDFIQRSQIVHLRRYDHLDPEELNAFNSTLEVLLGSIPSNKRLKTLSEKCAKQLYINSLGCIGTLKNTLTMCVSHAFRTDASITEDLILQFQQPNVTVVRRAKEAKIGERLLTDVDSAEVVRILDGDWRGEDASIAAKFNTGVSSHVGGAQGRKRRLRIGERNPTRDPVGGTNARRA
jgi:hypothetical protein